MRTEDGYIIHKCLNGDTEAFGFLVDKYKGGVYASAYARLRDFHHAEDVSQEVFIKAYEKLNTLKRWDSFASWLYRITLNICREWIRAASRRPEYEALDDQHSVVFDRRAMDLYHYERLFESLHDAMDSLSEDHRQVLTLHYLGGMTSYEIARFAGVSSSAIRKRLSKARSMLRDELLADISITLPQNRLTATFTLRIVDKVSRIKVKSIPNTTNLPWGLSAPAGTILPWGLSVSAGIILILLGLCTHPNIPNPLHIPIRSYPPSKIAGAEDSEIPVYLLSISQIPTVLEKDDEMPYAPRRVVRVARIDSDVLMESNKQEEKRYMPPKAPAIRLDKGSISSIVYSPEDSDIPLDLLSVSQMTTSPGKDDKMSDVLHPILIEGNKLSAKGYVSPKEPTMHPGKGSIDSIAYSPRDSETPVDPFSISQMPTVVVQVPKKAQIVFRSIRDGSEEIFIMDADGKNQRNLTNHPKRDSWPSWSPDGQSIAFDSHRDGNDEIYVMDADGQNQRNLTNHPAYDAMPSWSPDGQKIAFHSNRDAGLRDMNNEIYVMDADGKNQRRLTNHNASDWDPEWSPDGQKIAFVSERFIRSQYTNREIYVMDADGSNLRRLTNNPAWDWYPSWSPDGQKIAFVSERDPPDGNREIYVMDADGNNLRRLTNNPELYPLSNDAGPSWLPDGQGIVFVSNRDGNYEIYVMDADGKNQRNLTNHPAGDAFADWFDPAFARIINPVDKLNGAWGRAEAGE